MASKEKDPLVFLKAKSTKIVIAVACVLVLIILAVPLGIRYALQSYLVKNGATDAVISSLSLNPFTGTVKVKGVRVDGAEKRLLASQDFNVDIKLLSLFQKEVVIETAYYDKLTIDLHQEGDGRWRIASYTTPLSNETIEDQDAQAKEVQAPSEWNVVANKVLLTDCVVDFSMPEFTTQVIIQKAELTSLSTKADAEPAQFTFVGSVDGSPLNISLETLNIAPNVILAGEIDFQNYDLSRLQKILAPYLDKLEGNLFLKGDTELNLGEALAFSYKGDVELGDANISVSGNKINSGNISWQGNVGYQAVASELIVDGDLVVETLKLTTGDLNLSGKEFSLQGRSQVELADSMKITSSAEFESTNFSVNIKDLLYGHQALSWIGDTGYTAGNSGANFNGKLKLKGLQYKDNASLLTTKLGVFSWSGKGKYAPQQEHLAGGVTSSAAIALSELAISLPGETPMDLHLTKVELKDLVTAKEEITLGKVVGSTSKLYSPLLKKDFLEFSQFTLSKLRTAKEWSTTLESATVGKTKVFPRKDTKGHTGTIKHLDVGGVQWSAQNGVLLKKIAVDGLALQVVRDKKGSLNLGEQIAALSKPHKAQPKTTGASAKNSSQEGGGIRIDRFELGGKSHIFYKDYTLEVPFESESEITTVVLEKLNSKKPKQDSTLLVKMLLEKRAPLKIEGTLRPFAQRANPADFLKLKYTLKNYPIRNLSPYAVQNVGTALHSGELRLTGGFALSKGVVDSSNDLMLKRLTTKSMSAELAAKVDDKLPIPLDAALALLRDSDDNISLSLPIDGAVEKLNFDVSDAIIIALGKAVVPAASSYLVYALGPYGALAYVGMKVGENVLEVRLPPVKFAPEEIELTAESKDYLKRVGKIINDGKSQSDVQVCPVVSLSYEMGDSAPTKEEELDADDKKELEELGQTRAKVVRDHLINEYGVDEERLLLCITTIERKGDSEVLLHADQ